MPTRRLIILKLLALYSLLFFGRSRLAFCYPYGLSGVGAGRVGSVTAEPDNPFAALLNPALLAAQKGSTMSFGVNSEQFDFEPMPGVLVDSPRYRTETGERREEVYRLPSYGLSTWSLGFSYPFSLDPYWKRRAGLGIVISGPFNRLESLVAQTPYDFSVLYYGSSQSQLKAVVGASLEVVPTHLYFGTGISFYVATGGNSDLVIENTNPSGRLVLDVSLNSTLIFGLFGRWGATQLSLVYHQEMNPSFNQKLTARAQIIQDAPAFEIPLFMSASLYYKPHTFEWDLQHQFHSGLKASVGLAYELWSQYSPASLIVESKNSEGRVIRTEPSEAGMKNTLSPRISAQWSAFQERLWFSAGYRFRPSAVSDGSGSANLLDANAHLVGLSLQYRIAKGSFVPFPTTIGFFAQLHLLEAKQVTKTDPEFIGAPGYTFDGSGLFYGLSLGIEL